jgi:hypothetical protein
MALEPRLVSATDDPLFLEPVEDPIVAHGFAARTLPWDDSLPA